MLSRRQLLALAGAGLVAGLGAAGCAADRRPTLVRIRDSGTVRIGISDEEPYSYLTALGGATGESPEVARAVFAGLGVPDLEPVQRPFDQLIPTLLAGTVDVLAAGLAITPARCAQVLFSRPDFVAPTAFLVPKGNPGRLHTFADVARAGVAIAVLAGSVERDDARAAGIPDDRVTTCASAARLYDTVARGEAAVGALTDISLRAQLRRHPQTPLEVTPGLPDGARAVGAFAFRPADTDLRDAFDTGLTALRASGEWLPITAPFGVTAANLPPPGLSTEQLCHPAS